MDAPALGVSALPQATSPAHGEPPRSTAAHLCRVLLVRDGHGLEGVRLCERHPRACRVEHKTDGRTSIHARAEIPRQYGF